MDQQLNFFGVPEIQTSTCQVPVGQFSIWESLENKEVTQAECFVYQCINLHSNWDSGKSHPQSYSDIAKRTGMSRSRIIAIIASLQEKGWLYKTKIAHKDNPNRHKKNVYMVLTHKCKKDHIPLDKDGRPKKCAVPRAEGSPFQLVEDGTISWKAALYWLRAKVESDWTTGIIQSSIAHSKQLIGMTTKTICAIRKRLESVGLLNKLSKAGEVFAAQLLPKPYPKRRQRRAEEAEVAGDMPFDDKFYYSFNKRWKICRQTAEIFTKVEGTDKWRHANEGELERVNPKIYRDFVPLVELFVWSKSYRERSPSAGNSA